EQLIRSMQKRDGEIYAATANWIVSGIGDGFELVFVANTGYSVLKLLAHPSINRAEDLKGKKVGTGEPNSSQDRITRQALQRLGINPDKDVTLVPMGGRSITRLNALLKGDIDATTSNEDNLFGLERRGGINKIRVLADNESLKLFIGAGVDFAVSRALFKNSRSAVKRFYNRCVRPSGWRGRIDRRPIAFMGAIWMSKTQRCWTSCIGPMCRERSLSVRSLKRRTWHW